MRRSLADDPVAIIGAGPGGLAAALLLAAPGLKVTLFEKADAVGGRTRTVEAPDGYKFDLGPTFFLYPQILADIFAACGERLEEVRVAPARPAVPPRLRRRRRDPGDAGRRAAWRPRSPASPRATRRTSAASSPTTGPSSSSSSRSSSSRSSAARPRLPRHEGGAAAAPPARHRRPRTAPLLRRPARPPGVLVPVEVPRHVAVPLPEPVLHPVVPRVRARRLPPDRRLRRGDARRWRASPTRMGVEIRLGGPSTEVFAAGRAVGVRPPGASATPTRGRDQRRLRPRDARRLVPDRTAPPLDATAKIARKRFSCSTFMMYLGIEGEVRPSRPPHDPTSPRDYERNLREIAGGTSCRRTRRSTSRTAASPTRRSRRPGIARLYVLAPVTHQHAGLDWTKRSRRATGR